MTAKQLHRPHTHAWWLTPLLSSCALAACATEPPMSNAPMQGPATAQASPGPDSRLYVYPKQGQSEAQVDRDRYECHLWAVKQSGFDPSAAEVPPHQRVVIVRESGPPPGAAVAGGAFAGAAIGAAVSRPREAGSGAIIGAIAGAALGAVAAQDPPRRTERVVESQASRDIERNAANYRRAIGACLDARGYSVR
jgi:hypothetical protein